MSTPVEVNVYCDESCHLEHDKSRYMVLGSIRCPKSEAKDYNKAIIDIKKNQNRDANYEIKWTNIYSGNIALAKELIVYFFNNERLRFRGYIIDKKGLDHTKYLQNHDDWYFKMYYRLLEYIVDLNNALYVYIDVKDTRSSDKIRRLHEIFDNHTSSQGLAGINNIQAIQSHEVQIMQIVDLLIGAIRYQNEGLDTSSNKLELIDLIKDLSGCSLKRTIVKTNRKFNLFLWRPDYIRGEFR